MWSSGSGQESCLGEHSGATQPRRLQWAMMSLSNVFNRGRSTVRSDGEGSDHQAVAYCVSRTEWRWVLGWSLALLAVFFLPYALGYVLARPDERFAGILAHAIDTNTYCQDSPGAYFQENGEAGAVVLS